MGLALGFHAEPSQSNSAPGRTGSLGLVSRPRTRFRPPAGTHFDIRPG
jgi:hypothetical protein